MSVVHALADPRVRLGAGTAALLITAVAVHHDRVGPGEAAAFRAVNGLPESLYRPASLTGSASCRAVRARATAADLAERPLFRGLWPVAGADCRGLASDTAPDHQAAPPGRAGRPAV
jgi:hypothetical protein